MRESESEVAQLCPTLSDPMDCSLPGSSVHGIFQARVLEWGAIAFSPTLHSPFQFVGFRVYVKNKSFCITHERKIKISMWNKIKQNLALTLTILVVHFPKIEYFAIMYTIPSIEGWKSPLSSWNFCPKLSTMTVRP